MNYVQFRRRYVWNSNDPEHELGTGAFGKVYLAYDMILNRHVALKMSAVLTADHLNLNREVALITQQLPNDHKNIAKYETHYRFEIGFAEYDVAVLQYYPEGDLKRLITKQLLTLEQKGDIALQILEGIAFYQAANIIHRDLKPSNILIAKTPTGEYVPKIGDFGLSKVLNSNAPIAFNNSLKGGALSYAAPEQLTGDLMSANADLWSYGIILYVLYLGELPFTHSQTQLERREAHLKILQNWSLSIDAIEGVPEPFREWLIRCLIVDPTKRVKSPDELLALLSVEMNLHKINTDTVELLSLTIPHDEELITSPEFTWWQELHFSFCSVEVQEAIRSAQKTGILDVSKKNLVEIPTLVQYLTRLTSLNLEENEISDISALKDLKQLTYLNLYDNQIRDISNLKELTQLTSLDMRVNQINDVSALKELTQLNSLYLGGNQISDISALKALKQLNSLDLGGNQIHNLFTLGLQYLKPLTSLNLYCNQIDDIYILKELTQLTSLYLDKNQICDISALKELKQLTSLSLSFNKIYDVSALKELKQLTSLNLESNQIQNFNLDLNLLPNLNKLYLQDNPIRNIPKEIFDGALNNCLEKLRAYQNASRK